MVGAVIFIIWAHRMVQIMNFDIKTFSIHALELKLWLFEVCTGSHAFAMFAHKKITGVWGTLTTLYRTLYTWQFPALWGSGVQLVPLCVYKAPTSGTAILCFAGQLSNGMCKQAVALKCSIQFRLYYEV